MCSAERRGEMETTLKRRRPRPLPFTQESTPLTLSHSGWAGLGWAMHHAAGLGPPPLVQLPDPS